MKTSCDERFDEVKENLREAQATLFEIFCDKPWGYDEYLSNYLVLWHKRLNTITKWEIEDRNK
jgi:hypothetical protein